MAINLQELAKFSIEGARFQRLNSDGTMALPSRTVHDGKSTFDMSGYTLNAGSLTFKEDNSPEVTVSIDAALAVDPAAVTKTEMIGFLTTALTDYTVTEEVGTGLILIVYSGAGSPTYVQFYGEMAGTLGLGKTAVTSELGTKWKSYFNSVTGYDRAKNLKDGEEIEAEAGNGSLWIVKTSSIIKGENGTYNMLINDNEFKELIMGGVYNPTDKTYDLPNTDQTIQPKFRMQSFVALYAEGSQDRADIKGFSQTDNYSCTGMEGDISQQAKSWATLAYSISSLEWYNENNVKQKAVRETDLTVQQFIDMDVKNV